MGGWSHLARLTRLFCWQVPVPVEQCPAGLRPCNLPGPVAAGVSSLRGSACASGGRRGRAEAAEAEAAGSAIPAEGRGQRPRTDAAEGSAAQTSATGLSHQPLEKLQRRGVRRYLESQGVGVQDIPKAMLVYEGISMGIL